ncbi:hypothetical protein E2C01_016997 [Portunus trituberculatus]|uniref:Uncharacterized protein n=1 Tax=Portunus trituberculatus TaxID=210409 RepID=A0A5B7DR38_PORTR|nr:hypothetical protein [Portunus trituberculatus]
MLLYYQQFSSSTKHQLSTSTKWQDCLIFTN